MATSTFYSQIGANKRNSVLLVLAVVLLLGVLGLAIGWAVTGDPRAALPSLAIAIAIGLVASLFSYYGGDSLVLSISGAKEVTAEDAPQLLNVVQEMAIAANVPMPKVYLIDDTAPNAFATGRDPKHASVAITIGLLQKLDREELQGVMAHELSHVRNFDIRFSLLVGVLVGLDRPARRLLPAVHVLGRRPAQPVEQRQRGRGGLQIVVFVVAIVLAILAPIMARLVQLAVSRQREYLADASGRRADPEPRRPRAGAGEDRARHGAARGRQPGDPAPLLREPDQGGDGQVVEPVLDPSAGARPDQPPAGAQRPAGRQRSGPGPGPRRGRRWAPRRESPGTQPPLPPTPPTWNCPS